MKYFGIGSMFSHLTLQDNANWCIKYIHIDNIQLSLWECEKNEGKMDNVAVFSYSEIIEYHCIIVNDYFDIVKL